MKISREPFQVLCDRQLTPLAHTLLVATAAMTSIALILAPGFPLEGPTEVTSSVTL